MDPASEIDLLIVRFVDGQPFTEFWRAFMQLYQDFDCAALTPEQLVRFDQLYEWVYMGQPDPTTDEDRAVGLIGEAELRSRLRDFRVR